MPRRRLEKAENVLQDRARRACWPPKNRVGQAEAGARWMYQSLSTRMHDLVQCDLRIVCIYIRSQMEIMNHHHRFDRIPSIDNCPFESRFADGQWLARNINIITRYYHHHYRCWTNNNNRYTIPSAKKRETGNLQLVFNLDQEDEDVRQGNRAQIQSTLLRSWWWLLRWFCVIWIINIVHWMCSLNVYRTYRQFVTSTTLQNEL